MLTRSQVAALLAAVAIAASAAVVVVLVHPNPATGLVPFATYGELARYVDQARSQYSSGAMFFGGARGGLASPVAGPAMGTPGVPASPGYSGTNVQVAGVDEMDRVKTDGTYIYAASRGEVAILRAFPAASLQVVHRIALSPALGLGADNASVQAAGLFLDGSHLAVITTLGMWYGRYVGGPMMGGPVPVAGPGMPVAPTMLVAPRTYVLLFDVSNPAAPVLTGTVGITGTASAGRMVGSTIYVVATHWIYEVNGIVALPQTCGPMGCADLTVARIYHDPQSEDAGVYTSILSVDAVSGAWSVMSVITGGYSTLYMSPTALYLAFFKWRVPTARGGLAAMPIRLGPSWTTIYKLIADGLEVRAVASADVPGSIQGPYSMDEWNGDLRVATTVNDFSESGSTTRSDVYVFDAAMAAVGNVTGLAPGESIFAVRFVEDRAYVVTFRKIDPLFVIDLASPAAPKVLGFVEMPGFSDYLYPLDAGHLLGVGKGAIPAEGNFSWYQGLKLALYNVTDPAHPAETANVTLGDRGTNSEVLWDPHAFLYIPDRRLVVIPVDLAVIDPSQYPGGVPPYAWGNIVWQGVYVFHVDLTTGFQLVGRITHANDTVNPTTSGYDSPIQIHRSLYIGNVLYTISDTVVMANTLDTLAQVARVSYASATPPPILYA